MGQCIYSVSHQHARPFSPRGIEKDFDKEVLLKPYFFIHKDDLQDLSYLHQTHVTDTANYSVNHVTVEISLQDDVVNHVTSHVIHLLTVRTGVYIKP